MNVTLKTVGLVARSLPVTVEFYRALGFDIPLPNPGVVNIDFTTPSGVTFGFLDAASAAEADPSFVFDPDAAQLINLQFICTTPGDVDATFERLVAAGHPPHSAPWDAPWGQRFARVRDPDGRIVNLYAHAMLEEGQDR